MKKEEFAVGEVFQLGLIKLKVVEDEDFLKLESACKNCYFYEICEYIFTPNILVAVGNCCGNERNDNKSVHFVEVEEEQ